MNEELIRRIMQESLGVIPLSVTRFAAGLANYVYLVQDQEEKFVVRCSPEENSYDKTNRLLRKLGGIGIPVPEIIAQGCKEGYTYLILIYLEGEELGECYQHLTKVDKQTIAKEIIRIQRTVAEKLEENAGKDWAWNSFARESLDWAEGLIRTGGYFDPEKVERIRAELPGMEPYFTSVKPIPYLDDVTTKNLLIRNGHVSGVIDVDWIGIGDMLTFVALTYVALLNMDQDTDYVDFLLEELHADEEQRRAFLFYALIYCVDFMGERGTTFTGRTVEVNDTIIHRLNQIYDHLWERWKQSGPDRSTTYLARSENHDSGK